MNDLAYDYFKDNYGLVNDISAEVKRLEEKYKNYNRNKLKRAMKYLKSQNDNTLTAEIKFVARLLRSMVPGGGRKYDRHSIDHDAEIRYSFWKYVKRVLIEPTSIYLNFDAATCTSYFKKSFTVHEKQISLYQHGYQSSKKLKPNLIKSPKHIKRYLELSGV